MPCDTEELTVNSPHRFVLEASKNDVIWDLTAATVTLILTSPNRSFTKTLTGVVQSPTQGLAYADADETVLDAVGAWRRSWVVTQDSRVYPLPPVFFNVIRY